MEHDYHTSLGCKLNRCTMLLATKLEENFYSVGLAVPHDLWRVMIKLWDEPVLTQTELAERLYKNKSWLTRTLDEMESNGWIERVSHDTDRRINQIRLTPKALSMKPLLLEQAEKTVSQASKGISPEHMRALFEHLEQIQINLKES